MNKNKVAILTAAGTGIGADAAKHLASSTLGNDFFRMRFSTLPATCMRSLLA